MATRKKIPTDFWEFFCKYYFDRTTAGILMADFAVENPQRWRTLRARHAHPELTLDDLAFELKISKRTVVRHLRRTLNA